MSDFLQEWADEQFGTIEGKMLGGYQPPSTATYRTRFANGAKAAASKILAGDEPERMGWFTRRGHCYVVTLRMGLKILDRGDGQTLTVFQDAGRAAQFLEAAATAALAGQLDELLERARPKKRTKS